MEEELKPEAEMPQDENPSTAEVPKEEVLAEPSEDKEEPVE